MTGVRLLIGSLVMAIVLPAILFFLFKMSTFSQFFTIAVTTFLAWGAADLLSRILEKPRLRNRTPQGAIREEVERRKE